MATVPERVLNTLLYNPFRCTGCGVCSEVCPHGVFSTPEADAKGKKRARLLRPEACMECGACQLNCPSEAIMVESGVGCAQALIRAALTGSKEETCGPDGCGADLQLPQTKRRREAEC